MLKDSDAVNSNNEILINQKHTVICGVLREERAPKYILMAAINLSNWGFGVLFKQNGNSTEWK